MSLWQGVPGVAMRWDRIEGLDADARHRMPHAWLIAGPPGSGSGPNGQALHIPVDPNTGQPLQIAAGAQAARLGTCMESR